MCHVVKNIFFQLSQRLALSKINTWKCGLLNSKPTTNWASKISYFISLNIQKCNLFPCTTDWIWKCKLQYCKNNCFITSFLICAVLHIQTSLSHIHFILYTRKNDGCFWTLHFSQKSLPVYQPEIRQYSILQLLWGMCSTKIQIHLYFSLLNQHCIYFLKNLF